MSRYVLTGVLPGVDTSYVGAGARTISTLIDTVDVLRVDVSATDAPTSGTTVVVSDGTTDITVPLGAGATHVQFSPTGAQFATGADVTVQVTVASGALNLTVQVFCEVAGTVTVLANGLVTLAAAKAALGITDSDATRDTWLQRAINAMSSRIRDYCHRWFTQATYVEKWATPGRVYLTETPVISLTSVTRDTTSVDVGTGVEIQKDTGLLHQVVGTNGISDWDGTSHLEIVYTAGYAEIPADLEELIFIGLESRYQGWLAGTQGLGSAQGVNRVQYADGGAVTFQGVAGLGGDVSDVPDFLLGFPIKALDMHRALSRQFVPLSSVRFEVSP